MQKIYTVRPGDTLAAIAAAAKIKLADLLKLNPQIRNPNLIKAGQQIVLPTEADRSEVIRDLANTTYPGSLPEWFKIASREENDGVEEYQAGSNPRIVEYLATCTDLSARDKGDDGTAWCSAFVNWCMRLSGHPGTNSSGARSWRNWGQADATPATGDVTVWRRLQGPAGNLEVVGGHVAFLVEDRGDTLHVLGGNQGNKVCRRSYPRNGYLSDTVSGGQRVRHKYELIGFRKP